MPPFPLVDPEDLFPFGNMEIAGAFEILNSSRFGGGGGGGGVTASVRRIIQSIDLLEDTLCFI